MEPGPAQDEVARNEMARAYVAALRRDGSRAYVANLETAVELMDWGGHLLPVTVNDAEAETFVCSPRVGWIDYTREELARFPDPRLVPLLRPILAAGAAALSVAGSGRIVHVNNWMMSTNLPVPIDPALVRQETQGLVERFPGHILAMRSLTRRWSGPLMEALNGAGWVMVPARQVFLVDDVARDSLPRRDTRNDERLWRQSALRLDEPDEIGEAEAERIADLYARLYLHKYSRLNPAYTARFVRMSRAVGLIRYLLLRDGDGTILGFGGLHRVGRFATMPLIGYDTGRPRDLGLYRLVCHAGTRHAAHHGLALNMSSGVGPTKLTRGATAEIEYTAFHLRHLARRRRAAFAAVRQVANRIGIPILRRYRL